MNEKDLFARLLLMLPEIHFDQGVMEHAIRQGWLKRSDWDDWLTIQKTGQGAMRLSQQLTGKSVLQRIMILAPEVMSVQTVNVLRDLNLVDIKTAHALRAGFSSAGTLKSFFVSERDIVSRIFTLVDQAASEDIISLIRNIDVEKIEAVRQGMANRLFRDRKLERIVLQDLISESERRAGMLRAAALAGKATNTAIRSALKANSSWDVMAIFANTIFGDDFLRAAVKAGVIPADRYNLIRRLEEFGLDAWRKGVNAANYDNWYARSLMISEGVLSPEMIRAAKELGLISDALAKPLDAAARIVRGITRNQLSRFTLPRRYRVTPGETPLQTYARVARLTDDALLKLLNESARRSAKTAEALVKAEGFGNLTRANQSRLVTRELHKEMEALRDTLGPVLIFGQKDAAGAATAAMEQLQKNVLGRMTPGDQRSLRLTARSGLDNFVSRAENRKRLSSLVYKNGRSWNGILDREIQIGLLRGLSPSEFAKSISDLIRPDVRGGVSYAAMRLARTEINNAFHFTQIRFTREMPWVEGYQWNVSGSHPRPDTCDDYAGDDHDNLGPGVFKKKNVPGKPHPQCLCFLTTVTKPPGEFEKQLKRGSYNKYLRAMRDGDLFDDPYASTASSVASQFFSSVVPKVTTQARKGAIDLGGSLVMMALRDPVAASYLVRHFVEGTRGIAERMTTGAKGLTLRKKAPTPTWLREDAQLGPAANRLMIEASDVNFQIIEQKLPITTPVPSFAVPQRSVLLLEKAPDVPEPPKALVIDQKDWPSAFDRFPATLSDIRASVLADLDLDDLAEDFVDALPEETWGIWDQYWDAIKARLSAMRKPALERDLLAATAVDLYAGSEAYFVVNSFFRSAQGSRALFAAKIDSATEQYQGTMKTLASLMESGNQANRKLTMRFLEDMASYNPPANLLGIDSLMSEFVVMMSENSALAKLWLDSGETFGEFIADGYKKMTSTHKISTIMNKIDADLSKLPGTTTPLPLGDEGYTVYRSTTSEWFGASSIDDLVGLVGETFVDYGVSSAEIFPRYFGGVKEWYHNVRVRVQVPKDFSVGIGAADEAEIMFSPGSRFVFVDLVETTDLNEEGETIWEAVVLALAPDRP